MLITISNYDASFVTDVTQPGNHEMIASCARSTSMSLTSEARSISVASNIKIASKYFRTNDGVRLHYLEAGGGKPLVLVHGFSQTAEQF